MGFLSGLFHSRDKPTNSTNSSAYRFLFGGSNSGKAVNERSARQMTAVYACVRILSESIAGLPVHVYKYTDSASKEKAIKHPLYQLIHDEPNPEMTSFVFISITTIIIDLLSFQPPQYIHPFVFFYKRKYKMDGELVHNKSLHIFYNDIQIHPIFQN